MRALGLLVPDGVGLRNFVLGSFFRGACASADVHVFHTLDAETLIHVVRGGGSACWHDFPDFADSPALFVLRQGLSSAHMHWADTPAMRTARRRPIAGSLKSRSAMGLGRAIGRLCATPARIERLERLYLRRVGRSGQIAWWTRTLEELRPALLFCSHQRPLRVVPPVLAARRLGIPSVTFIFSWDNLTSKGRIAAPFDHYLVWSELMRDELRRFYPGVAPGRIHVVGTPQFDPYADESLLWSREEFCRRVGAEAGRPLICYSGGDAENAPEDPQHLRVLLEMIRSRRIRGNPQVVLRPSPADDGRRYAALRREFAELVYAPPAWLRTGANWSAVVPLADDVPLLANLVYHCQLNVNFASTMTLDFSIHDKPVVNLAFDVSDPRCYRLPMWDYVCQFPHYEPVRTLKAARFARSADELAAHVNAYLRDPGLEREGRRRFVELEVGVPIGQSAARVLETLHAIAHG